MTGPEFWVVFLSGGTVGFVVAILWHRTVAAWREADEWAQLAQSDRCRARHRAPGGIR